MGGGGRSAPSVAVLVFAVISGSVFRSALGKRDFASASVSVARVNDPNPLPYHNMTSVAPSRLAALVKTRCAVFQTSYNPTSVRTGAKYLRARLRGPSMMNYYPPTLSLSSIIRQFPEMELVDAAEQQRLQDIEDRKKRGKGTPKKAKSKGLFLFNRFLPILSPDLSSTLFCSSRQQANFKKTVETGPGMLFVVDYYRICLVIWNA